MFRTCVAFQPVNGDSAAKGRLSRRHQQLEGHLISISTTAGPVSPNHMVTFFGVHRLQTSDSKILLQVQGALQLLRNRLERLPFLRDEQELELELELLTVIFISRRAQYRESTHQLPRSRPFCWRQLFNLLLSRTLACQAVDCGIVG